MELLSMDFVIAFVLAIVIFTLFLVGGNWDGSMGASFDKKFPPIDDDEFIRRCYEGVDRDIALRVRKIVAEQLGVPYEQIYPEQNFVNDLIGC